MNLSIRYLKNSIAWLAIVCSLASLFSCQQNSINKNQKDEFEGLIGKIIIKEGNFDASGNIINEGKIYSEQRKVFVYQLTGIQEVAYNGYFTNAIYSDMVAETTTDEHGHFKLSLPSGDYSVFVEEQNKYFSELKNFKNDFYFFPITIHPHQTTSQVFEITISLSVK